MAHEFEEEIEGTTQKKLLPYSKSLLRRDLFPFFGKMQLLSMLHEVGLNCFISRKKVSLFGQG